MSLRHYRASAAGSAQDGAPISFGSELQNDAGALVRRVELDRRAQGPRHGINDLRAEPATGGTNGAGPADTVVLDANAQMAIVLAHQLHTDLALSAIGIGIFISVGDEFGNDHAEGHCAVGR